MIIDTRRRILFVMLGFIGVLYVPRQTQAQVPSADPAKSIAAALQPFVENHSLAGAVMLVANGEKVLSLEAIGFEDVAAGKPMRTDALFWIASQSKPMTATAFMMLVDEGKVSLDDPVAKFLPEFKRLMARRRAGPRSRAAEAAEHPITVRQILSHTSGMPFTSAMEKPTLDLLPLRDAVRSYAMTPLQTEPGSKYPYSNAGINTAGRIIEVVSGMPYEDFMDKRLFEPLGMKDTTFWPNESNSRGWRSRTSRTRRKPIWKRPRSRSSSIRSTTANASRCPPAACSRRPAMSGDSAR